MTNDPVTNNDAWRDWREEATDICALPLVQRVAALLDQDAGGWREGEALPQGWHAILFTPAMRQSLIGPDGHPHGAGGFAPPDLPRRMLGGRRLSFEGDLPIGAEVRRTSLLTRFDRKQGRSGALGIASLQHTITLAGSNDPLLVEEQDIIYREAVTRPSAPSQAEPDAPRIAAHTKPFTPDPVMLFRYSAITFNGHRIHYDQPYATTAEGYPALVVNGGLTALVLLEFAKTILGRPLKTFGARNRRPLFCDRPARLCVAPSDDGWALWAEDESGQVALEASAQ